MPDGLLAQAEELLQRDRALAVEEPALAKLVQRSRDQKRARERRRRILLGGALLVALVFAVVAWFALVQRSEAINQTQLANVERDTARMQLLAMQARREAEADMSEDIERAGALALASIEIARKSNWPAEADAIEAASSALTRLPLVVLSEGSWVWSLAVLADGRLASGGGDGTIKLWLVDEQNLIAALCLRAGRNLTKDEWARYIGADTPWQPSCRDLSSNWRTPDS